MKVSRREFFKISGAVGAGLFGTYLLDGMELEYSGKQVSRTTGNERIAIKSTCLNCYARCGIIGYVEYKKLMKIGGNSMHPNSRGRVCAKGQAGLNLLYDPTRIKYPLRRAGKRGDGNWKRISWEEAFSEISSNIKMLISQQRSNEILLISDRDITSQRICRRFLNACGSSGAYLFGGLGCPNKRVAQKMTWGEDVDINDVAHTQYILNFGSNPYEAHILRTSFAQRLAEGRSVRFFDGRVHSRAKLVTFDVRLSNTAGRSDEWHPIRPGTDGIVALAMANVIMKEGLYDGDFIEKWTNYPVDKLKEHLSKYTLKIAEQESGVHANDIRRIAEEFATTKPATTISTGGVTKHSNGVQSERCIVLLNVITGNVDVKGGYCMPRKYDFAEPEPAPPEPPTDNSRFFRDGQPKISSSSLFKQIEKRDLNAGFLMTTHHNPAYADAECGNVGRILSDTNLVPFHVVIDSHISETAALADIILPMATYLERFELESPPAFEMVPFVSLRRPLVDPVGESKSLINVFIELSRYIGQGAEKYFDFTEEEYLTKSLSNIEPLLRAGGLEYLKEHGLWFDESLKPSYKKYLEKGFSTPSKKIEIYSAELEDMGHSPLPEYARINEHKDKQNNMFYLTTFQWNVHTHFHTANLKWLSEIVHSNPLWINPEPARALGLMEGDRVKVTSRIGSIVTTVSITEGIHPEVVAISDNCGHWEYGGVAMSRKFKSDDPDTQLVWWEKEGHGAHPNSIIPAVSDAIGGGQAWMDALVKLEKIL